MQGREEKVVVRGEILSQEEEFIESDQKTEVLDIVRIFEGRKGIGFFIVYGLRYFNLSIKGKGDFRRWKRWGYLIVII